MNSSPFPFRWSLAGSALFHALLLAFALALVRPGPAASEPRLRARLDLPPAAEESLSTAAEAAALPEVALPEVREPATAEAEEVALPLEDLDPLPAREPRAREGLPFDLSLSVVGRRTKAPPRAAEPPPRATAPAASPASSSAAAVPAPASAPLRLVHAPAFTLADYPVEARRLGIEGTALVRITIGTSGAVVQAVLLRSSGSALLDGDALRKSRLYRFAPIPSPRAENLPVRYRLD